MQTTSILLPIGMVIGGILLMAGFALPLLRAPRWVGQVLIILGLVLLGLFGGLWLRSQSRDTVWLAAQPLEGGRMLAASDVLAGRQPLARNCAAVADTAAPISSAAPIVNRRIVLPVSQGCPLTEAHLEPIRRVPVPIVSIHSGDVISKPETIFSFTEVLTDTLPSGVIWNLEKLEDKLAVKDLVAGQPVQQDDIGDYLKIPVPQRFIPAKTLLTEGHFIMVPIGVTSILTDTLLTLADILPAGKTMQAARHLLPGQPLDDKAISAAAEPAPLTSAYIAQRSLPAFVILTEGDVQCANKAGDACQGLFNPQAYLLLAKTEKGAAITRSHVITATEAPEYILELSLAAPGALSGALSPGDWVDVYASSRWLTDTLAATAAIAPGAISGFSVKEARVLQIAPVGERYRVVLWLQNEADVRAIATIAAHAEFNLALRRRER